MRRDRRHRRGVLATRAAIAHAEIGGGQFAPARSVGLPLQFDRQPRRLLALRQRDVLIHLRQRRGRLRQPLGIGHRHQGIGLDPVLRHDVAVEAGDSEKVFGTGIAAPGGILDIRQRSFAAPILEQHQAISVGGLQMPPGRRLGIERLGLRRVRRHAAPEAVGLAEIEHRIGISRRRRAFPFVHGHRVIAPAPGIDPGLDVGRGRSGGRQRKQRRARHDRPPSLALHRFIPAAHREGAIVNAALAKPLCPRK